MVVKMAGKPKRQPVARGNDPQPGDATGDVSSVSGTRYGETIRLVGHDLDYEVTTVETDNGPEITHLWIKGSKDRPITTDDLRRIPLRRLAKAAAEWTWLANNPNARAWGQPERRERRSSGLGDEHYQQVAEFARNAFQKGVQRVREATAEEFRASPFTVDKWLRECRNRGYLQRGELQRRTRPNPNEKGTQPR
jgi:hypothetical protein